VDKFMKKAVVYTISSCPASKQLKKDLTAKGIKFMEKQVDENQKWLDEALTYGDAVPIIVYGDGRIEVNPTGIPG
jgi:glutaredoxin